MKKAFSVIVCIALAMSALLLTSCDIISDLTDAVKYPDSYTLTYEVTSAEGIITTISKTVDKNGNVYYKNAETEVVYIKDGSGFIKYEKSGDGIFAKTSDSKITKKVMEEETAEICSYAEESKMKLMPSVKQESDTQMLGRECEVYKLGVGTENNSSYTYYYVDKETGICLGKQTKNTALGTDVSSDGDSFVCTEFSVDDILDVSIFIGK